MQEDRVRHEWRQQELAELEHRRPWVCFQVRPVGVHDVHHGEAIIPAVPPVELLVGAAALPAGRHAFETDVVYDDGARFGCVTASQDERQLVDVVPPGRGSVRARGLPEVSGEDNALTHLEVSDVYVTDESAARARAERDRQRRLRVDTGSPQVKREHVTGAWCCRAQLCRDLAAHDARVAHLERGGALDRLFRDRAQSQALRRPVFDRVARTHNNLRRRVPILALLDPLVADVVDVDGGHTLATRLPEPERPDLRPVRRLGVLFGNELEIVPVEGNARPALEVEINENVDPEDAVLRIALQAQPALAAGRTFRLEPERQSIVVAPRDFGTASHIRDSRVGEHHAHAVHSLLGAVRTGADLNRSVYRLPPGSVLATVHLNALGLDALCASGRRPRHGRSGRQEQQGRGTPDPENTK